MPCILVVDDEIEISSMLSLDPPRDSRPVDEEMRRGAR
jgi:hypothetical protein